jgi:glucosamine--fructose-6-phosphate aminotransferase (isomerizing)
MPEKRGYDSFMLKEIHEQPQAVGETIARNLHDGALGLDRLGGLELAEVRRVVILACGTAYHAGQVGSFLIEEWAGVPCDAEVASEWRYRRPLTGEGTLVVGISQSGETADTLAGLRLARQCGAPTLAITNSPGLRSRVKSTQSSYTHAGLEMGVAATKTFTRRSSLHVPARAAPRGAARDARPRSSSACWRAPRRCRTRS